jgi:hypothetical protein
MTRYKKQIYDNLKFRVPIRNTIAMIRTLLLLLALTLTFSVQSQGLKGLLKKAEKLVSGESLTDAEISGGLKEALELGVGEAVDFLSAEDGYYKSIYKILLPEEARQITSKLKVVPGFADAEEKIIEKVNRAAEGAASKATPIFVGAIKGMQLKDALNILMGEQDAATRYLESNTYDNLYSEFKPVVIQSLDEWQARDYWRSMVEAYNKIPFVKKANPELDDYVTEKALIGIFKLIEKKEIGIRDSVGQRTSPLLQKVFAQQDNK